MVFIPIGPVSLLPGALTTLLNAAAAAGNGVVFSTPPGIGHNPPTLNLYAVLTGVPTTVTVNLQVSGDGGVTWQTAPSGGTLNFVTSPDQAFTIVPGKLYRINLATLSGGTTPTVTINGTVS